MVIFLPFAVGFEAVDELATANRVARFHKFANNVQILQKYFTVYQSAFGRPTCGFGLHQRSKMSDFWQTRRAVKNELAINDDPASRSSTHFQMRFQLLHRCSDHQKNKGALIIKKQQAGRFNSPH